MKEDKIDEQITKFIHTLYKPVSSFTTEIFCGAEQHKQAQSIHTEKSDT